MIRALLRVIFGKEAPVPVTDETGTSYREQLLRGLLLVSASVAKYPNQAALEALTALLKDLRDFEYGADRKEAGELRRRMEELEARINQVEGLAGLKRPEGLASAKRGRLA